MREDWEECLLGDICEFVGGGTPSKSNPEFWNGEIPWASIKDIKGDSLDVTQDFITEKGLNNSSANLAMPNEIIIGTRINPGKPIISKIETAINQDLKVVKCKIEIDTKYLFFSFKNSEKDIVKVSSGTTVLGINLNNLRSISFLLAPLPEQRAIVAKIEELFSDLDNGIADLKKAQEQLKIYRQAVLKKAFEGELTKKWRVKQTNLPTAEELLEKIKEEQQKHYEQQIEDWKKAVKKWEEKGKDGKNPGKPKKLISYPFIEQSGSLPTFNLGELAFQISHKLMPDEAPEHPFIGMDCLEKNALKPHFTYKFKEFRSAGNWFNINHVLYGRLRPYLNKVYQAEYEGVASGEFIILETIKGFQPNYLKLILHQQDFVHWSNKQSSGDKPRVKFDQIALYKIKVPSVLEQNQIIREIESRLSVCYKVEQTITEGLEKAKALRQSILKKAFEGKLLSTAEIEKCKQEKDYEPASVLLARIERSRNKRIKKEKKK
ncbi:MAG: restriction endonuclease subunit S [Bacteroidales bacterium]|nr:restriction endonuclease subunit S [Bacteroidales bacterium]